MVYAREAGDAWGVITRINHDNNHHINSWWILLMGRSATPFALRSLSIAAGTALIVVLGRIGLRRGPWAGVVTAAIACVCPILVVYGSEARGYSCAMLAFALMIAQVDAWLAGSAASRPTVPLLVLAIFGTLSHLLMVPATGLLLIWVVLVLRQREGRVGAEREAILALGPALLVSAGLMAVIIMIAMASPTGLRIGGYIPFTWTGFGGALAQLLAYSSGLGMVDKGFWVAPVVLIPWFIFAWRKAKLPRADHLLYTVLLFGMPIAVALFELGNAVFPRYYLPTTIGLILWLSAELAVHITRGVRQRLLALTGLLAILTGSLAIDAGLLANARAHPERVLATVAQLAPGGTSLAIETEGPKAYLTLSAEQRGYPLTIVQTRCGTPQFRLVERKKDEVSLPTIMRCGQRYDRVDGSGVVGVSGVAWALYQRSTAP